MNWTGRIFEVNSKNSYLLSYMMLKRNKNHSINKNSKKFLHNLSFISFN